jgi:hypothetical protein
MNESKSVIPVVLGLRAVLVGFRFNVTWISRTTGTAMQLTRRIQRVFCYKELRSRKMKRNEKDVTIPVRK